MTKPLGVGMLGAGPRIQEIHLPTRELATDIDLPPLPHCAPTVTVRPSVRKVR